MSQKMLIDARQPEETRVALIDGNRLEEFDFELADRKQIRGNIYLAKVIRVEASLQAAFLEYGGGRHGFLPFSEIHPDYYNIPVSDRADLEAMLAEIEQPQDGSGEDIEEDEPEHGLFSDEEAHEDETYDEEPHEDEETGLDTDPGQEASIPLEAADVARVSAPASAMDISVSDNTDSDGPSVDETPKLSSEPEQDEAAGSEEAGLEMYPEASESDDEAPENDEDLDARRAAKGVDEVGGDDLGQRRRQQILRRFMRAKNYRIQEVIKTRQILLIQVSKEERGNKGAALTTNISLPGRYCVLMPNTARGGGVSRKITNLRDRKRLKAVMDDLTVPDGMSLILRTAGIERSKAEIKRDYSYLMKLWDDIRDRTLNSIAPALIHEESNLIKRSIRDLYRSDTSEIIVAGEEAHKTAKSFMKALVPSHVRHIKLWDTPGDLFRSFNVDRQIDAVNSREVKLKSGGYLVIDQTEAMIAIDVNSGRATRQRNIEDTALRANLEAAEEVARQMRLRDLAGLIVIDFIDMDIHANDIAVEKRLKEALKTDRARIQVGRIGPFGLLELSRQRMRPNLIESKYSPCPACKGRGLILNFGAATLLVLRTLQAEIERQANKGGRHKAGGKIVVKTTAELALHILNTKREAIGELEAASELAISFDVDPSLTSNDFELSFETGRQEGREQKSSQPRSQERQETFSDEGQARRGKGRRSRRAPEDVNPESDQPESAHSESAQEQNSDEPRNRRRRRKRKAETVLDADLPSLEADSEHNHISDGSKIDIETRPEDSPEDEALPTPQGQASEGVNGEPVAKPRRRRRSSGAKAKQSGPPDGEAAERGIQTADGIEEAPSADDVITDETKSKPRRTRRTRAKQTEANDHATDLSDAVTQGADVDEAVPAQSQNSEVEHLESQTHEADSTESRSTASIQLNVVEVGAQSTEGKTKGGWWSRFSSK